MLKDFSIENFKGYEGRYDFNFPGLTYLTGANNSGKSSVIQALYMLALSNSGNSESTLILNKDNYYTFGDYSDVLNKNCSNQDNISFEFGDDKYNVLLKYSKSEIENYNPELLEMQIDFVNKDNKNISYSFSKTPESSTNYAREIYQWDIIKNNKKQKAGSSMIFGLTPEILPRKISDASIHDILDCRRIYNTTQIKFILKEMINKIHIFINKIIIIGF